MLLAIYTVEALAEQITYTVNYNPAKLSITYDTIDGVAYARVGYEGLQSTGEVQEPSLPKQQLLFSVPYYAANLSVQIIDINDMLFDLSTQVIPNASPYNQYLSRDNYLLKDSVIYKSYSYFPSEYCNVTANGCIYGDNHVVSIGFNPVRYNPVINKLQLVTRALIVIKYDKSSHGFNGVSRGNDSIKNVELNELKRRVVNPEMVIGNRNTSTRYYGEMPDYENTLDSAYTYCIITKRPLAHAFRKIIGLKRQKGISAGVVCLEDLKLDEKYSCGDWHDCIHYPPRYYINDDAGVVREYLKYAHGATNTPTQYVLLGGDRNICPIRLGGYIKDHLDPVTGRAIPTDLYFCNLECDWDIDLDNKYGEFDKMKNKYGNYMFHPNLYVGRLLCENEEEIENYTSKLVNYSLYPGQNDASYLSKGLISQAGDLQYSENCAAKITNAFTQNNLNFNLVVLQENNGNIPTGANVIDSLNYNYGFVSFHGHGTPVSIEVGSNQYQSINYALFSDSYYPYQFQNILDRYENEDNCNSLDSLKNNNFPNVTYSTSCTSMPYDIYEEETAPHYLYNVPYNIGQVLTTKNKRGSVAFLGYTRPSFYGDSISNNTSATDLETLFLENIKAYHKIGIAEAISKWDFDDVYLNNSTGQMKLAHNLLGDPEIDMWTETPQKYEGLTLKRYNSFYLIEGITPSDTIAYCDNEGCVRRKYGSDEFDFFNYVSPSASILVYNHNHIPFIFPLLLQNCKIYNSQYVYASSFSAGQNIISFNAPGNVVIKNGAVYEVEATDDVNLGKGFIVENGATFAIKTPSKVTIDGCVFQSGANVKIEAGNIEIVKNCTAERGAKVEITKFFTEDLDY